jgi:hypothetical protein
MLSNGGCSISGNLVGECCGEANDDEDEAVVLSTRQ